MSGNERQANASAALFRLCRQLKAQSSFAERLRASAFDLKRDKSPGFVRRQNTPTFCWSTGGERA
jgi:hypothetical protein